MNKNNFLTYSIACLLLSASLTVFAQTNPAPAPTTPPAKKASGSKKKMKIDFESDTVMGTYDTPDASFINSRRMIKYKELFNKRTNFIEEIESNKGLFNEYQK